MVVTETGGTPGIYCISIQRYRTYNVWQSQRRTDPIRHDFQINIPHVAKKLVYNMEIQYLHIVYTVQGMIYTVLIDTEFPECKYINQINILYNSIENLPIYGHYFGKSHHQRLCHGIWVNKTTWCILLCVPWPSDAMHTCMCAYVITSPHEVMPRQLHIEIHGISLQLITSFFYYS